MKVSSVSIENFMGLAGTFELSLNDLGLVHVSGRNLVDPANNNNGACKTTIWEAVTWCLFGEGLLRQQGNTERGVQADEVLNDQLNRECKVSVALDDSDGSQYVVERWRKWKGSGDKATNGVRLWINGAEPTSEQALDDAETNRLICLSLGINHEIWSRGVVFGQDTGFNFCAATALQRQSILTTVGGLEEIDVWRERCRETKKAATEALARVQGEVAALASQEGMFAASNTVALRDEWEANRARKQQDLEVRLMTLATTGRAYSQELGALQAEAAALPQLAPAEPAPIYPQPVPPPEFAERIDALMREVRRADSARHVVEGQLAALQKQSQRMAGLGQYATCPTCDQPITAQHVRACTDQLEVARAPLLQAGADADQAHHYAETALAQEKAAQARWMAEAVAAANAAQAAAQAAWQHRSRDRDALAQYQADLGRRISVKAEQLNTARRDWQALERERSTPQVNPYIAQLEREAVAWAGYQARVKAAAATEKEAQQHLDECLWWEREIPRLKTWLFDGIVDNLANEANRWLQILSGGVVWVQISTQRELASSKKLKDEIEISIYRWNPNGTITQRGYRLWSGGEKRRVALAIDLALARLLSERASKSYRFLVLDEVDRNLDSKGKEGLRRVLDELKTEKDTMLVVTHDPDFRASFDRELTVTRDAKGVTLEMSPHA